MPRLLISPLAGAIFVMAACGSTASPNNTTTVPPEPVGSPQAAVTVEVRDNFYSPVSALISVGGTVTWNWAGIGHSVTSDGSPTFSPSRPISDAPTTLGPIVFATAGTYTYHCTAHGVAGVFGPGLMSGAVFVR